MIDNKVVPEQAASKDIKEIIKLRGVLTSIDDLLGHDPIDFAIIGEMIFQALKEPIAQPEQTVDDGMCRSCIDNKCTTGPECVTYGIDNNPIAQPKVGV